MSDLKRTELPSDKLFGYALHKVIHVECFACGGGFTVPDAASIEANRYCPSCREEFPADCWRCGGTGLVPEFPAPMLMAADSGKAIGRDCPACGGKGSR